MSETEEGGEAEGGGQNRDDQTGRRRAGEKMSEVKNRKRAVDERETE